MSRSMRRVKMLSYGSFFEEFIGPTDILSYLNSQGLGVDYKGGISHPSQLDRELHAIDNDQLVATEKNDLEKPLVFFNGAQFIETVTRVEKKYRYRLFGH